MSTYRSMSIYRSESSLPAMVFWFPVSYGLDIMHVSPKVPLGGLKSSVVPCGSAVDV